MSIDETTTAPSDDARGGPAVVEELRSWLAATWDPDLTCAQWWALMAEAGWSAPTLPPHLGGRGVDVPTTALLWHEMVRAGVVGPPSGIGPMLAVPTLAAHGTTEQQQRFIPPTNAGRTSWCQLFSEPGSGSDLASAQTRAVRDGDEWVVTGQKVWTSGAQLADRGLLIARTDPAAPKHAGLTYFALDMHQPGITIRPLREMTGRSLFNEVFLDEVRVSDADRIGEPGLGWTVARSTLEFERRALGGPNGGRSIGSASAGTRSGHLDRRVGDLVHASDLTPTGDALAGQLSARGAEADPAGRQALAQLNEIALITRVLGLRLKAGAIDPVCCGSLLKLWSSRSAKLAAELGMRLAGPYGMLWDDDQARFAGTAEAAVWAPATSIYGGTDQIQRNILGERILGLPRDATG